MKQIIWSSDALLDETAREYYQNFKREELDDDADFFGPIMAEYYLQLDEED